MERLINADKFKKQVAGMTIANSYSVNKANALCELIDAQPTAYDPDKVVEQLEDYSDADEAEGTIPVIELTKAIEIVKGGGVDDNPNSNNDYRPDM